MKLVLCVVAATTLVATSTSAQDRRLVDGHLVYVRNCAVCHTTLSPMVGDKAAWEPFIKMGTKSLVKLVISSGGTMPPRGGHLGLSDQEIAAAVEYIVSRSR